MVILKGTLLIILIFLRVKFLVVIFPNLKKKLLQIKTFAFFRSYVVALVCPDRGALGRLADRLGKTGQPVEDLVEDKDVVGAVLREIVQQGKIGKLQKFEIPGAVSLFLNLRIDLKELYKY